jgi:hypothetical protein
MWGALFVWIGLMMIVDEDPGIASIGAGVILLTGALIRRSVGRRAGFLLSVNGLLLLLLGINDLNGDDRGIPLLATTLMAIGALIITRAIGLSRRLKSGGFMITMERPGSRRDDDFD